MDQDELLFEINACRNIISALDNLWVQLASGNVSYGHEMRIVSKWKKLFISKQSILISKLTRHETAS
jgi:hypothetical protein